MKKGLLNVTTAALIAACMVFAGCGGQNAETPSASEKKPETEAASEVKPETEAASKEESKTQEPAETEETEAPAEKTEKETEKEEWSTIAIGTTGFTLDIPSDYRFDDVTDKEQDDDQISYLKSFSRKMDFDIYQFEKDGDTLEECAKEEAAKYGAEEVEMTKINGFNTAVYYSTEDYEDETYPVSNYMFDAGEYFAEVSFWLDGEDAAALSESIISSLSDGGVEVGLAEIENSDPPGVHLILSNPGEMDIDFDVSAYTLRSGDERFRTTASGIFMEAGKKNHECVIYTSENVIPDGAKLSLYYGNLLIEGTEAEASEAEEDKEAAETPAKEETAPASDEEQAAASFVGDWKVYAVEYPEDPESNVTHEMVVESKEQGFDYSMLQILTLNADGTYVINMLGEVTEGIWADNGDGTGTIVAEGTEHKIAMDGDLLYGYADDNTTVYEHSEVSAAEAG